MTSIQVRSHTIRPTICGMVRDLFDTATARITPQNLREIAAKTGMHPTTVRLQFYRWRAESKSASAQVQH